MQSETFSYQFKKLLVRFSMILQKIAENALAAAQILKNFMRGCV